jgi:hypothetical protein
VKNHVLKLWPEFFKPIKSGQLTGCIRPDDRNFQVGDQLQLLEYLPTIRQYTGKYLRAEITYIIRPEQLPIVPEGFCILSLRLLE